jgi:hypothetical protein
VGVVRTEPGSAAPLMWPESALRSAATRR